MPELDQGVFVNGAVDITKRVINIEINGHNPGGALGRRLPMKEMSESNLGLCLVGDAYRLEGIVIDGDLRRAIDCYRERMFDIPVSDISTQYCKTVTPKVSVGDAFEKWSLTTLMSGGAGRKPRRRCVEKIGVLAQYWVSHNPVTNTRNALL